MNDKYCTDCSYYHCKNTSCKDRCNNVEYRCVRENIQVSTEQMQLESETKHNDLWGNCNNCTDKNHRS